MSSDASSTWTGTSSATYAVRPETRHEHLAELRRPYGFRSFSDGAARELRGPETPAVERWFGLLSQRAIKRGSFRSVADLVNKIQAFIDAHNTSATPFVWVATAQSILDKGGSYCDASFRDSTLAQVYQPQT